MSGFARQHAQDLRDEARKLRAIGLNGIAEARDRQSELYERIADDAERSNEQIVMENDAK